MSMLQDLLSTGAGKTLTFKPADAPKGSDKHVGYTYEGKILRVSATQAREYKPDGTGQPATWKDGTPKMQFVIDLQLNDGEEGTLYLNAWGEQKRNLQTAIARTGLDADNALAAGGVLWIRFEGKKMLDSGQQCGWYTIKITPAVKNTFSILDAPETGAGAAHDPWASKETAEGTETSTAAADSDSDIARLIKAGLNDKQISDATGLAPEIVATIRASIKN